MSEESREARSVVDSIDDALHGDESLVLLSVDDLFVLRAALDLLDRLEREIESWKRYKAAIDQAIEEGGYYKP